VTTTGTIGVGYDTAPPTSERADRIGSYWGNPKTRTFAELLIDCEEGSDATSGLVGMLREVRPDFPLATEYRDAGQRVTFPQEPEQCPADHDACAGTSLRIPPPGSALLGQRSLSARAPRMAPHAHCSQVGEVTAAAGLGLDDVIDLGGSADADDGVAQLALVTVSLEHLLADHRPAAAVRVEVGRWRVGPGSPPALGAPGRRLPARNDRDPVGASVGEAHPHHRGSS
jgi:hypothetical protein